MSAELGEMEKRGRPNPNSGIIWHYGGADKNDKDVGFVFGRTLSTPAISEDGLLFASDLSGFVYCLDVETGERKWRNDLLSGVWASPQLYRDKVLLGDEDGHLNVFDAVATENQPKRFSTKGSNFIYACLLYTSPSPRDATLSRMPSSA